MVTRLGKGSCNKTKSKMFPEDGLFAHIGFIVPAGWPDAGLVTKGANVSNTLPTLSSNSTLAGVFINNGGEHTANVTDTTGNGGSVRTSRTSRRQYLLVCIAENTACVNGYYSSMSRYCYWSAGAVCLLLILVSVQH
jgi:hypothetical protein